MKILKKFLGSLILVFFCFTLSFAQENPKTLIVFYSRDGHTKLVAEKLAQKFNADLEQLIDKKDRVGPINMVIAGKDATTGNLTEIGSLTHEPKDYDIILIGTPGWFSNVTPAVRTFLNKYDVSTKKLGIFGTSHLSGIPNALKQVSVFSKKAQPDKIPTLPLFHKDLKDEAGLNQKIDEFYKKVIVQ